MATTNMGLTLPSVSLTPGPAWASLINAAFDQIDSHDHTSGKGKGVPSAGININDDLSFAGFSAKDLLRVGLVSNAVAPTDDRSIYVSSVGDLWYRNASSNAVQITNGASIVGTAGSIGGLVSPAAATFGSGVFAWLTDSGTGSLALLQAAALQVHASDLTSNGFIQVKAPAVVPASYATYLPSAVAAGAGGFLMMRSSGQQEYAYPDNISIYENPSNQIAIKTEYSSSDFTSAVNVTTLGSIVSIYQKSSISFSQYKKYKISISPISNSIFDGSPFEARFGNSSTFNYVLLCVHVYNPNETAGLQNRYHTQKIWVDLNNTTVIQPFSVNYSFTASTSSGQVTLEAFIPPSSSGITGYFKNVSIQISTDF